MTSVWKTGMGPVGLNWEITRNGSLFPNMSFYPDELLPSPTFHHLGVCGCDCGCVWISSDFMVLMVDEGERIHELYFCAEVLNLLCHNDDVSISSLVFWMIGIKERFLNTGVAVTTSATVVSFLFFFKNFLNGFVCW